MLNIEAKTVKGSKGMDIPFKILSKNPHTDRLAIILPGSGYTSQAPLLHFSAGVFISKGYDVLQVNYLYNGQAYEDFSEISEAVKLDVKQVLDYVLSNKSYNDFYFIGKSLGTIAMSSELSRDIFKNAKAIWLTPLIQRDDVFTAMTESKLKGLCIMGDSDPCYTEERFLKATENKHITSKLIPNVNHSLEYDGNPIESIEVLKHVIHNIEQF